MICRAPQQVWRAGKFAGKVVPVPLRRSGTETVEIHPFDPFARRAASIAATLRPRAQPRRRASSIGSFLNLSFSFRRRAISRPRRAASRIAAVLIGGVAAGGGSRFGTDKAPCGFSTRSMCSCVKRTWPPTFTPNWRPSFRYRARIRSMVRTVTRNRAATSRCVYIFMSPFHSYMWCDGRELSHARGVSPLGTMVSRAAGCESPLIFPRCRALGSLRVWCPRCSSAPGVRSVFRSCVCRHARAAWR